MTRTIRVTVTAAMIRDGKRGDCEACPVFRAVRAVDPRIRTARMFYLGFDTFRLRTPEAAKGFMAAFDAGLNPPPFSFNLEVPA